MIPVLVVAGKPGDLVAEDNADLPQREFGQQFVEATAGGALTPGEAEVGVDDPNAFGTPAESLGALGKLGLVALAFLMLLDLFPGGLADIDTGPARQVGRGNL